MMIPVILSGGAGTRLWPVSREALPKPFMKMADGKSLLSKTVARAAGLGASEAWIVTNRDYYFLSRDDLADSALNRDKGLHYLLEPVGRNTAPAIALAAHAVSQQHGPDTLMLVLAADHIIQDQAGFAHSVKKAVALADMGLLVTFGMAATAPETGFGYIEAGDAIGEQGFAVRRFVEKPRRDVAEAYLAAGNYYWNSGMFCFRARDFLQALELAAPELAQASAACWQASQQSVVGTDALELDKALFAKLQNISVDYAVFEKANNVAVVPGQFGWSDVGAWPEIAAQFPADEQGNQVVGDALLVDTHDTFVHAGERLVSVLGMQDVVIVDTPDALLVMPKDRAQDVKKVVEAVKATGQEKHIFHATVARPWGTYTTLLEGRSFKLKRIEVKPQSSLSLQMHHYRNEHWVVVEGTARVTNGDQVFLLATNESTYIKAGTRHRLENPGMLPLVIIEVQSGQYTGEDDIVRYDDKYGRSS